MQVAAYKNGSTYQLWQLHRLAKEHDCQDTLLKEDAIGTLVPLLSNEQLADGCASILQRLAVKEGPDRMLKSGMHPLYLHSTLPFGEMLVVSKGHGATLWFMKASACMHIDNAWLAVLPQFMLHEVAHAAGVAYQY